MNGTVAFAIFLLQFDKEQLCIGCFHTSYRLFAKCFLRKQSLHCNISLYRALPYSCLCSQISVYQFTDCHLSVYDIYKQREYHYHRTVATTELPQFLFCMDVIAPGISHQADQSKEYLISYLLCVCPTDPGASAARRNA